MRPTVRTVVAGDGKASLKLFAVVLVACCVPALRAARLDPGLLRQFDLSDVTRAARPVLLLNPVTPRGEPALLLGLPRPWI